MNNQTRGRSPINSSTQTCSKDEFTTFSQEQSFLQATSTDFKHDLEIHQYDSDSFGSPGSPPSSECESSGIDGSVVNTSELSLDIQRLQDTAVTPFVHLGNANSQHSTGYIDASSNLTLEKKLEKRTRLVLYYCEKAKQHKNALKVMDRCCKQRICNVQDFWKNKIYRECTRSGKTLKKAMQNDHQY